jgi:hypothetical protein
LQFSIARLPTTECELTNVFNNALLLAQLQAGGPNKNLLHKHHLLTCHHYSYTTLSKLRENVANCSKVQNATSIAGREFLLVYPFSPVHANLPYYPTPIARFEKKNVEGK